MDRKSPLSTAVFTGINGVLFVLLAYSRHAFFKGRNVAFSTVTSPFFAKVF